MILRRKNRIQSREKGYMLLAVMLVLTLMLIAMTVAAPRIAQQIRREREEELVHRGKDYATAIKRFVHKNGGRYPVSLEQLENTNHIRFLRKRYLDPTTGEANWRLVHAGEAEIKIPTPNPGLNPSGNPGLGGGNSGLGAGVSPSGKTPLISAGGGVQANNQQSGSNGQLGSLKTSNIGNGPAIGGGQIIGVASVNKAHSIKEFNEKDHYDEWLFVYDLRVEQAGGSGVVVAAPRAGSESGGSGPFAQPQSAPQPGSTPAPTPPPVPQ